MTRISNLAYADSVAQTDVLIISDGQLTKQISVADFKLKVLTQATKDAIGSIRVGNGLEINDAGVLSVKNYSGFTLQPATQDRLGGIRIGTGLFIDDTGVVSAIYDVPIASPTQLGSILIGDGLSITPDGVLSVASIDRTKFDDTGIEVGTDGDIKIYVESNIPKIKERRMGILDISVADSNMSDGFSNIRFASSITSHELGNELRAALLPDPEGESIDLGVPAYPWHSIYARNLYGNLTGNIVGDTSGNHTGNVLANDLSVAYDSFSKQFYGNLTGNVVGNVDTASKLYTPRAINGVYFDGSADITVVDSSKLPRAGGIMTGYLTLVSDPVETMHATSKQYVDNRIGTRVPAFGGTMTGFLTLNDPPQQVLHAATKGYVDDMTATRLAKTGGELSGFLTLHADPTAELHAATKDYVDNTVNTSAAQLNISLTNYIDQQDNTKLPLNGGTMAGFIKLHAAPTDALHAATKLYVDTGVQSSRDLANTKIARAGDTMAGRLGQSVHGFHAASKADISVRTDSGFYDTSTPTVAEGWPTNGSWHHLISSTHVNDDNYYAMQFSGDFYDSKNVYYRATSGSGTTAWNKIWHSGNDGAASGLNADIVRGIAPSVARAVNTIAVRDGSNILYADLSGNSSTATKLQTPRAINGVTFDGSTNISFYDIFTTGTKSPGPTSFPEQSIRGFSAYNSTDFPGQYFGGLTVNGPGNVYSGQLAFNWNAEEAAPTGIYFRVNDDTSVATEWSSWSRIATMQDLTSSSGTLNTQLTDLRSYLLNYIDTRDSGKVSKSGDSMSGYLTLVGSPVSSNHAATKYYVDSTRPAQVHATYGSTTINYYSTTYFDIFPPGGYSMANLLAFMPAYASQQSSSGWWWWYYDYYYNYNANEITWSALSDRIRVYISNNYYYYYYYYNNQRINWLAVWR